MPQVAVNSSNIDIFRFSVTFDIYLRKIIFKDLGTYINVSAVKGITFSIIDEQDTTLASFDFTDPQIKPQNSETTWELDLSSTGLPFFFQTYQIVGAIQDSDDVIYYTTPAYPKVCQPVSITESGYVPGTFQITPNCPDNSLSVKELTLLIYNNQTPESVTKSGNFYYPTGTAPTFSFSGTPFSLIQVFSGQYRIKCSTVGIYNLDNDIYVYVTYLTNNVFDVSCSSKIADLICCMVQLQDTAIKQCNNAVGKNAHQQLSEITIPFLLGLTKEINGQDASTEAELIRKTLKCNCGVNSITQNEMSPINPTVYDIIIKGVGGTSVTNSTNGSTKTFVVSSNTYIVAKGETGDLAFTITTDTNTSKTVKYLITFNYDVMAGCILNAISDNPTWVSLLNSLISSTGNVDLTGLDGKCVINLSSVNALLTQNVTASTKITSLSTSTQDYGAPDSIFASNASVVQSWLNSLGVGTFIVTVNSGVLAILSLNNTFNLSTLSFSNPYITIPFQKTNATLVSVLQAIIDYLCALTSLQVYLGNSLSLCLFDYNGVPYTENYLPGGRQSDYNYGISQAICNIVNQIYTLTGITCAKIAAVFPESPNSVLGMAGRLYGNSGDGCVAWSPKQIALAVITAINSYDDVKSAYCNINCTSPSDCPEISDINMAIVGSDIGIYGVSWATVTFGSQTIAIRYKLSSSGTWITSTNSLLILPNGNIIGTTPFVISGLTAGQTYDVQAVNSCGGVGFIKQITTPTGSVYSGSFLLDSIIYDICGNSPVTLYSSRPFGIGVTMYSNAGLTIPVTGFAYIANTTDGEIFTMNTGTGVVLTDTGTSCDVGTAVQVILSNTLYNICGETAVIRYLNGVTTYYGQVLYQDAALTTPVTGYIYVILVSSIPIIGPLANITNLNSISGVIGSTTGFGCSPFSHLLQFGVDQSAACGAGSTTVYSSSYFGVGIHLFTDSSLTTPVTGFNIVADPVSGLTYNIDTSTGIVTSLNGGSCF